MFHCFYLLGNTPYLGWDWKPSSGKTPFAVDGLACPFCAVALGKGDVGMWQKMAALFFNLRLPTKGRSRVWGVSVKQDTHRAERDPWHFIWLTGLTLPSLLKGEGAVKGHKSLLVMKRDLGWQARVLSCALAKRWKKTWVRKLFTTFSHTKRIIVLTKFLTCKWQCEECF